ncbi:uncharacterized protein LOC108917848 [Anoplophora glabripennis]|uniref:uncharacterized protein LOC108917848 n=1 Tax=Anoplophora glabripennis TaxID=217634 RepID=UPI000875985C|nr:uncharacterized protein LOC108917848 [Anoplophora glabripennis]
MEWTVEASLTLIELYKKQPVLWNTRHSYYYSKVRKQSAWEQIACSMDLGVDEVRQKMNSLLGSFRRERSKMRRGEGRYALGNFASRWFAFDKLLFLWDRHEAVPNDKVDLEELQRKLDEEGEDNLALDSDSNHLLEEELNAATHQTSLSSKKQPRKIFTSSIQPPPTKKTKFTHDHSGEDLPTFPAQEECSLYARYLAEKLMRMSCRTRALVQRSINNIIFEADLGKYEDTQQTPTTLLSSHLDGINLSSALDGFKLELDQLPLGPEAAETVAES